MADSALGVTIEFFKRFGIFDVVLPFWLVFTVVFAILQKSQILGENKKNLDATVAFVVAMLVVAATKIVKVINTALPQVTLLVVVALSFLLMIGIFMKPDNTLYEKLSQKWMTFLMIIMFIGVVAIFLNSIYDASGNSFLEIAGFFITLIQVYRAYERFYGVS